MRKWMLILTVCLWAWPAASWAIEGFSGSLWGIGVYEALEQNPRALGQLRQGIDWFRIYDAKFTTYAQFRYRFEDEESEFFDAYGPSLGLHLKRGPFRLGWEYEWERFPGRNRSETNSQFFLEWWYGWDLKKLIP